jgi:hypothetical protein
MDLGSSTSGAKTRHPGGQHGFAVIPSGARAAKLKQTPIKNQPHQARSMAAQSTEIARNVKE